MATVIRFARHGTKKRPFFRMVVQDSRSPRDGRFIEHIGSFRPTHGEATITVDRPRLEYWLGTGALMSASVKTRLRTTMAQWKAANPTTEAPVKSAAPKAPKEPKAAPKKKASKKEAEAKS